MLCALCSHEKIKEILNISHQIKLRGTDILFAWIPAHVGKPGNDEADRLARSIVTVPISPQDTPISKNEIKNAMKYHCSKLWDEMHKSSGKGYPIKSSIHHFFKTLRQFHTKNQHHYFSPAYEPLWTKQAPVQNRANRLSKL